MHSWLIRLGCGGPDSKALRRLMIRNLDGYCAFPDEARAQKHRDKYKEMRRSLGRTVCIRDNPHICLAAGENALLFLQCTERDDAGIRQIVPVKYIVARYPTYAQGQLVWGQGEYYDVWAYRENDGIPATAKALRDASLSLAGRKLSVAMWSDDSGTKCAGVFTTESRAETWLEKARKADADAQAWMETKHVNRPEKDL